MSSYLQPDVEADHLVQYTEIMLSIKGFSRNRILLKKMKCWSFFRRRWLQPFLEIPAMVANWIWSWWLVSGRRATHSFFKNAGRKKSVVCSTCLLYLIETWHMETISSCVVEKKKGLINFFLGPQILILCFQKRRRSIKPLTTNNRCTSSRNNRM